MRGAYLRAAGRIAAAVLAAACLLAGVAAPVSAQPLRIARAEMWIAADPADAHALASAVSPGAEAPWRPVTLPHQWTRGNHERPGVAWFRLDIEVSAVPPADPALYLSRLSVGGVFLLNGTRVASPRATDELTQMRWRRPHLLPIPPAALASGHNTLLVRIVTRDAETFFPEVLFGPEAQLRTLFDRRYLAEYSSAQFSAVAAAVVAVFMFGIWWYRRSEPLYLLFGMTCLFWALRTQTYLTESVPWAWWWPWRAMYNVWIGCFALSIAAFFLSYIGRLVQRWQLLLVGYAAVGPALLLLSNGALQTEIARYWIGGLFVLEAYVLWTFYRWIRRHPSLEGIGLALAAVAIFVLAANDYAVRSGWMPYSNPYAIHFGAPVVMLAMGALLAARFVRALRQAEAANQELTRKVQEKERELALQYEQLRSIERNEARSAERQRIMQDMHDGLGSQLLTSLAAVERGALDTRGMAQVLRDAMDDMRLAIDTLSPSSEGLLEALGNLRYRLEPRFRAAGIELKFALGALPERLDIAPQDGLQILRVLQESLTNVIKHAGAREVRVEISLSGSPALLTVVIADDGRGFDAAQPSAGRGLSGMRRRAARIGAQLEVASGAAGTRVALCYAVAGRSEESPAA